MLEFTETNDCYVVTQHIMGFRGTETTVCQYKKDLSERKINNEPWQATDKPTRKWFRKYHMKHFVE